MVLNRVRNAEFPNTVWGVIFDRKNGVQFTPVANGTVYDTPLAASVTAARICMEGETVSTDILYFFDPDLSTSFWIAYNRPYAFTILHHRFYK